MELLHINKIRDNIESFIEPVTRLNQFIEANTEVSTLEEIRNKHIIPVFARDNEPLISHADFIEAATEATKDVFIGEPMYNPQVRISHPVKGRVPEAKHKPSNLLEEWERTIYYERMAFLIEIPGIKSLVGGNTLSLSIGGVKAYNQDNLYSRNHTDQHFKIFIGFQNKVCTNLCVSTDGYLNDVKVKDVEHLYVSIRNLIQSYNYVYQLEQLEQFQEYSITENQFAHLIGRCRMYQHLPTNIKAQIEPILFGDQQITSVVKDYYKDQSFCRDEFGNINLWRLYNLFTGANKSSYIDSFLDKSVNASLLMEQIKKSLQNQTHCWYLQ